jgi:hypothetical protein
MSKNVGFGSLVDEGGGAYMHMVMYEVLGNHFKCLEQAMYLSMQIYDLVQDSICIT